MKPLPNIADANFSSALFDYGHHPRASPDRQPGPRLPRNPARPSRSAITACSTPGCAGGRLAAESHGRHGLVSAARASTRRRVGAGRPRRSWMAKSSISRGPSRSSRKLWSRCPQRHGAGRSAPTAVPTDFRRAAEEPKRTTRFVALAFTASNAQHFGLALDPAEDIVVTAVRRTGAELEDRVGGLEREFLRERATSAHPISCSPRAEPRAKFERAATRRRRRADRRLREIDYRCSGTWLDGSYAGPASAPLPAYRCELSGMAPMGWRLAAAVSGAPASPLRRQSTRTRKPLVPVRGSPARAAGSGSDSAGPDADVDVAATSIADRPVASRLDLPGAGHLDRLVQGRPRSRQRPVHGSSAGSPAPTAWWRGSTVAVAAQPGAARSVCSPLPSPSMASSVCRPSSAPGVSASRSSSLATTPRARPSPSSGRPAPARARASSCRAFFDGWTVDCGDHQRSRRWSASDLGGGTIQARRRSSSHRARGPAPG